VIHLALDDSNDLVQLGLTVLALLGLIASTVVFRACFRDWRYAVVTREWPSIRQMTGEQATQELIRVGIHLGFMTQGAIRLLGLYDTVATQAPDTGWGLVIYTIVTLIRVGIVGQSLMRWWSRGRVLMLERASRRLEAQRRGVGHA
jgi:hypothetical protein